MNHGYICPGKKPLLCAKMFEDQRIMRDFNEWQVSTTGDLANIRGLVYLKASASHFKNKPAYSVQIEYLKKSTVQHNKAQVAIGRIEKMLVCAKPNTNFTSDSLLTHLGESKKATGSTLSESGEQCCVTKRACGLGYGGLHDNGCSTPPPELELPLKGY